MKKLLPLLALLIGLAFVGRTMLAPKNTTAFDTVGFGRLPVLANGRVKPLDTIARSSLLQLQGRQRVSTPERSEPIVGSPTEWLLDVAFRPDLADTYPTFAIDNPELLSLLGKNEDALRINYPDVTKKILAIVGFLPSSHRRFSFNDIKPYFRQLDEQAKLANPVESAVRTPFQRAVLQLYGNLIHYQRLRHTFILPGRDDFLGDLLQFQDKLAAGVAAVRAKQAGQAADDATVSAMTDMGERFIAMSEATNILAIPPDTDDPTAWQSTGAALLATFQRGSVNPHALAYAGLARAWRSQQSEQFNKLLELFRADLVKRFAPQLEKSSAESRFNAAEPFYSSTRQSATAAQPMNSADE